LLFVLCCSAFAISAQQNTTSTPDDPFDFFSVYSGATTVYVSNTQYTTADVTILDVENKTLASTQFAGSPLTFALNVPDGYYTVHITNGTKTKDERLYLQNQISIMYSNDTVFVTCGYATSGKIVIYNSETQVTVADKIVNSTITKIPVSWVSGTYLVDARIDGKYKSISTYINGVSIASYFTNVEDQFNIVSFNNIVSIRTTSLHYAVRILNVKGQQILAQMNNSLDKSFVLNNVPAGIYLVQVTSHGRTITRKVAIR